LELATLLARDRHDLIFVARSRDRLEAVARGLKEEYGVSVTILPHDLSRPEAPAAIAREVEERGLRVGILVNNAGFGVYGPFVETPIEKELAMLQVNVTALTHLTKLFLPAMRANRRGRILNVASTAAFQPGPLMAVYYATKAYVLSFTEALANELDGSGVTATALCPGPTITEFQKEAGVEGSRLFRSRLVMNAADVARAGYAGMQRGKRLVIPGAGNFALVEALRFTPRRLVTAIARRIQETKKP
jgi:short-subunit dehydrogenase